MKSFKKFISIFLVIAFIASTYAPLLAQSGGYDDLSNLTPISLDNERETYKRVVTNDVLAESQTALGFYQQWYQIGRSHFPFSVKQSNFVDAFSKGVDFFTHVLDPATNFQSVIVYRKVKTILGSLADIALFTNKTRLAETMDWLTQYNAFKSNAKALQVLKKVDGDQFVNWMNDSIKKGIFQKLSSFYKSHMHEWTASMAQTITKSSAWTRLMSIGCIERMNSRIPDFLASYKNVMAAKKNALEGLSEANKALKCTKEVKIGEALAKAQKGVSVGLKVLAVGADVAEAVQRCGTIKDAYKDSAFGTTTRGQAIYASIKLATLCCQYIPGPVGGVFKILDAAMCIGEILVNWWAKHNEPTRKAISAVESSDWEQYYKNFQNLWKWSINKESIRKKFKQAVRLVEESNPFPDAQPKDSSFDITKFIEMRKNSYNAMLVEINKIYEQVRLQYKNKGYMPNYLTFVAMAFLAKNWPPEETPLSDVQKEELERFVQRIALASFYFDKVLPNGVDKYLNAGITNMSADGSYLASYAIGGLYGLWAARKNENAVKDFKKNYSDIEDIHFKLFKIPGYIVMSRFHDYYFNIHKELRAKNNYKPVDLGELKDSGMADIFTGYCFNFFEYQEVLQHFKKWDKSVDNLARCLPVIFNLFDDIKIHNELIKLARDELEDDLEKFETNMSGKISEDKEFRNPDEHLGLISSFIRATAADIAARISSRIKDGKFDWSFSDFESAKMRYEKFAINQIYMSPDYMKYYNTKFEAKNEYTLWIFHSGVTATVAGENLAPLPKAVPLSIADLAASYPREFGAMYKILWETWGAIELVYSNRLALMCNVYDIYARKFPPLFAGSSQAGYYSKAREALDNCWNKSKEAMDGDSDSNLTSKYNKIHEKLRKILEDDLPKNKAYEKMGEALEYHAKIYEPLFTKLTELSGVGKLSAVFVYHKNWALSRAYDFRKDAMILGENTYNNNLANEVLYKLKAKYNAWGSDDVKIASEKNTGFEYYCDMEVGSQYFNSRKGFRSPVFVIVEKYPKGEKDPDNASATLTRDKYKGHLVY